MPNYSYAYQNFDKSRQVRSALREKDISHKHAREIALALTNLSIEKARDYLESNAEYKGMDLDRLKIINIVVHKGTRLKRFTPRAMGRASPKFDTLVHVEMV